MDIDLLFKIAGIGILVAVLNQVLTKAGREDQAMMTTLTGIVIVLMLVIKNNIITPTMVYKTFLFILHQLY